MKYETPEMTALMPAINAIQRTLQKFPENVMDSIPGDLPETVSGFADWE